MLPMDEQTKEVAAGAAMASDVGKARNASTFIVWCSTVLDVQRAASPTSRKEHIAE